MTGPRLFALPPGIDFPRAFVDGLLARMGAGPPEALARVRVFVNSARMRRRIREEFDRRGARLLPRIALVDELGDAPLAGYPPPEPPLRRRLMLAQLIGGLLDRQPELAPVSAIHDLADSLAALLDEMQDEGLTPEALTPGLAAEHAQHFERSLAFVRIAAQFFGPQARQDRRGRLRTVAEAMARDWAAAPPADPVVIAGSTGSRGPTAILMDAVSRLPGGWVVLPGFDFDMPAGAFDSLTRPAIPIEDHPQYRYHALMRRLGLAPAEVGRWTDEPSPNPRRAAVVSLALRPAPVTDRWMTEGAALSGLEPAMADATLVEAPDPRSEAVALSLILRKAVEDGRRAALVTPDRTLARRVSAALDRWGIVADDSAGVPLAQTAPGRFLRQAADLLLRAPDMPRLLAMLKHPLTATGAGKRGDHLRFTRDLELRLRRRGPAFPDGATLTAWAAEGGDGGGDGKRRAWAEWLAGALDLALQPAVTAPLADHVARHLDLAGILAAGPGGSVEASELWGKDEGREAGRQMAMLRREAGFGGRLDPAAYADLLRTLFGRAAVRAERESHPLIAIWGTLEARAMGADLVVLAGLNEGLWPTAPAPDPWLSRQMRLKAGLLLPERAIGLSAHDFQQAASGPEVVFSRALRDAGSETVPSRWLARLTNLLGGLPQAGGTAALAAMRDRGQAWIDMAAALDAPRAPAAPAARPAPRPPVAVRPPSLSVTEIERLIRDPYAIYARHVLGLRPLAPVSPAPDARLRGEALHALVEAFVRESDGTEDEETGRARLLAVTDRLLAEIVPWPAARRLWRGRIERLATAFVADEAERRRQGRPVVLEQKGAIEVGPTGFRLVARPDRIDRLEDGRVQIYDYKTGAVPSPKRQRRFDNQLLLEACMVQRGAFPELGPVTVAATTYVRLGGDGAVSTQTFDAELDAGTWNGLLDLIARYQRRETPYPPRVAMFREADESDYDHLSRFGEWPMTEAWQPEDVE